MSAVTLGSAGLVPSITVGGIEHDILHHGGALSVHIGGGSRDGGNIIAAGGVTAASTGTVIFSNDNNVSFGLVGSVVTASVDISAAASADHTHGTIFTSSITGDVLTNSSTNSGLTLGVPEWLTTAAQTDHTHGTINFGATTNSTETAIRFSSASDGLTMVQPSFLTTAASISHTHNYAGTGISTGTISSNLVRVTLNTDGLSLRIPNYLTTYAGGYDLTIGGTNTSGTLTLVSSGTVTLAGGSNITLSQVGNAITIVGPDAYGGTNIVGTGTSVTTVTGTNLLLSANTAGISISHPDWKTTGVNISVGGTNTLGTVENISNSTVIFYGGNNISLSQNDNSITIIGTDNISAIKGIAAQGSTFTSGTVYFSAQSNISIRTYLDGSSQYVRFSVPDYIGTTTAATNIGLTANTDGIRISVDTAGMSSLGDGVNIMAVSGVTANSKGTVVFSNGNGVGFGMSTEALNSLSTITASYSQSTHAHPFVEQINGSSGSISFNTGSSLSSSANVSGITLGLASNISTAWSGQTTANSSKVFQINGSSGSISFATGSSLSSSLNGSTITLGLASNISTAWSGQRGNILAFAGTTADSTRTLLFSNENGISFGMPSASVVTANFNSSQFAFASDQGDVYFIDSNGMSFGTSTGLSSTSITVSYTVPAAGELSFSNTNGISFGTSINGTSTTLTASVQTAYIPLANSTKFPQVWQLSGNTANSSSSSAWVSSSIMRLYGGTNITLSGGSAGISIVGGAGGGVAIGDGVSTLTSGTVLLIDSNNVSFGISGQSVTATVAGISAIGHSDNFTQYTTGAVGFIGENLTVSTSVSGTKQYISYKGPALGYLYFSNTTGATWSSTYNGISTSIWLITA